MPSALRIDRSPTASSQGSAAAIRKSHSAGAEQGRGSSCTSGRSLSRSSARQGRAGSPGRRERHRLDQRELGASAGVAIGDRLQQPQRRRPIPRAAGAVAEEGGVDARPPRRGPPRPLCRRDRAAAARSRRTMPPGQPPDRRGSERFGIAPARRARSAGARPRRPAGGDQGIGLCEREGAAGGMLHPYHRRAAQKKGPGNKSPARFVDSRFALEAGAEAAVEVAAAECRRSQLPRAGAPVGAERRMPVEDVVDADSRTAGRRPMPAPFGMFHSNRRS